VAVLASGLASKLGPVPLMSRLAHARAGLLGNLGFSCAEATNYQPVQCQYVQAV